MTSALEPFSAARVVQSSDHASQNLGQSLFKHMELKGGGNILTSYTWAVA